MQTQTPAAVLGEALQFLHLCESEPREAQDRLAAATQRVHEAVKAAAAAASARDGFQ